MSDDDFNDDERDTDIDERFDEIYRFYRDLIDDPWVLSVIPDGSELRHRSIQLDDRRVQLTAHRPSESVEPWTARVTSWDSRGSLDDDRIAFDATQGESVKGPAPAHRVEDDDVFVRTAETADAAIDALEHVIRQRLVLIASGGQA